MMNLSREQIETILARWLGAWNRADLDGVIDPCHPEVVFENWTGAHTRGKEILRDAWRPWFEAGGGFTFTPENVVVIDVAEQKAAYTWVLDWPCFEKGFEGKVERRRGVDVVYFTDGMISGKFAYSKTTVEIDGRRVPLVAKT